MNQSSNKKHLIIASVFFLLVLGLNFVSAERFPPVNTDSGLGGVMASLQRTGIFDILLPFLFIYIVVFTAFMKSKVFEKIGDDENSGRKFSAISAAVIAILAIVPHFTPGLVESRFDVIYILQSMMPQVSMTIALVIFVMLFYGILFGPFKLNKGLKGFVAILSVILVLVMFLTSIEFGGNGALLSFFEGVLVFFGLDNPDNQAAFIFLVVIGFVIWWITRPTKQKSEKESKPSFGSKAKNAISKMMEE